MIKFLDIALAELGTKEIPGAAANPRIIEYDACTTLKATSDEVPWCSAFANWVVKTGGGVGTKLANARSWLNWGVEIDTPTPGCIVVFRRGSDPAAGHVAFYKRDMGNGLIEVVGGNQADQVKVSRYPKADVLGYRIMA